MDNIQCSNTQMLISKILHFTYSDCYNYTNYRVRKWYSCQVLMKLEFFRRIFEDYSNTRINENSSIWSQVVPYGLVDGQV
jgi:hypothetical protein